MKPSAFSPYRRSNDSPPNETEAQPLMTFSSSEANTSSNETVPGIRQRTAALSEHTLPFIPPAPVSSRLFENKDTEQSWIQRKPQSMLDQPLYRNMEEISKLQETMQSLLNDQARLNLQSPEREEQEKQHDSQNESRSSSIKATRKALTETIRELAEVYRRQTELCKAEMQKRQLEIDKLEKWAGQRKELERVLKNIPLEPQFAQIKKLDQQYMRLDAEIQETEERLIRLKAQRFRLSDTISHQKSILEERLAPASKRMEDLDRTVNTYLRNLQPPGNSPTSAKEQFSLERAAFISQHKKAKREADALRAGVEVWEEVVEVLEAFGRRLKSQLSAAKHVPPTGRTSPPIVFKSGLGRRKLANSAAISPSSPPPLSTSPTPKLTADDVLISFQPVVKFLKEKLEMSLERDWKLLIILLRTEIHAYNTACTILTEMGASSLHVPDINLLDGSTIDPPKQNTNAENDDDNTWNQSWGFSPAQTKPSSPDLKKPQPLDGKARTGSPQASESDLMELLDDGVNVKDMEELERTIVMAPETTNTQSHDKGGYWGDGKLADQLSSKKSLRPKDRPRPRPSEELPDFLTKSDRARLLGISSFQDTDSKPTEPPEDESIKIRKIETRLRARPSEELPDFLTKSDRVRLLGISSYEDTEAKSAPPTDPPKDESIKIDTIETPGDKVPSEFLDTHSDVKNSSGTGNYVSSGTENYVDLDARETFKKSEPSIDEKVAQQQGNLVDPDEKVQQVEEKGQIEEDKVPDEFLRSKPEGEGAGLEGRFAGLNLGGLF